MKLTRVLAWRLVLVALIAALFAVTVVTRELVLIRLTRAQAKSDCPVRVTLLQVNDVYQFAPVDGGARGGLARVSTLRSRS